ncbi:HAD domain-containing protein [Variovorax sp. J31P207]|uniref:HAD domain-containing protein n=1 Tax=Variovorax sp. J31P207 TaxID=3053510 RepID=UPI00257527E7|nr:HAD domain-containing protein [Variovorax sp. J31P207]MDM0068781.1 HAD domain-containing protein [Variovorax sp. J31P207]
MTKLSEDAAAWAPAGSVQRYLGKAPKGRGELILWLDYDGVVHCESVYWSPKRGPFFKAEGYTLFEHAPLLAEVLEPYPSVRIVLSTSWVRLYSCDKAAKRLPDALRARVIGATFHTEMNEGAFLAQSRGQQVAADIRRRQPRDWLALDDTDEGWPEWCRGRFIRTHEELGISEPSVLDELKRKLALLNGKGLGFETS